MGPGCNYSREPENTNNSSKDYAKIVQLTIKIAVNKIFEGICYEQLRLYAARVFFLLPPENI